MKLKIRTFTLLLAAGAVLAIGAKPAVQRALGESQGVSLNAKGTLESMTERQLEDKYGRSFTLQMLDETQVGARYESILSQTDAPQSGTGTRSGDAGDHLRQTLFFHAAGFKVGQYFRIQDDYELQRLVRPIVEEEMGAASDMLYDLTYASPDLFTHIDEINTDWNELLKNRARSDLKINLVFYAKVVPKYELAEKLNRVQRRLENEHLGIGKLRVYRVDEPDFDEKLLTTPSGKLAKIIRETCKPAAAGEGNRWGLECGPFAGFD
ncbi:hypothetical protein QWJ34_01660 [Saccharibacillus sp. CPCC 101409]|uniref:hypothetical protein n=1 Tax=Saccharibacillus sp. CPCC 101409 TaxID=3058041 RepID=UPI002671B4E1|nr:hypothetical protein [Saccharibacillus sp. CPCC 101409]MDO3408466.1 hypothetical protein [Saccharibacillus sp. CPCC 101409]